MESEVVVTAELSQRPNETPLEHHRRLVYGKLVDRTLADYDYTELSQYVYGKQFAPDVARREMYGSRYTLQLMDAERIENSSDRALLDEIDSCA